MIDCNEIEVLDKKDKILDELESYIKDHPESLPKRHGNIINPKRLIN